jgi:hypothetical protein
LSSIFDHEVILEISFDYTRGQKQTWDDPGYGPEIDITAVSGRMARLRKQDKAAPIPKFSAWIRSRLHDYEPHGGTFEIHDTLWPTLKSYHEDDLIEHVCEFHDAAE